MWELCTVFHIKDWFLQSCWLRHIWTAWTHQTDIQYIPCRNTDEDMFTPENTSVLNPEMCFSSFLFQVCDWIALTQSGSSLAYIRVILPPFVMSEKARRLQFYYDPLKMVKFRENEGREKSKKSIKITLSAEVRWSLKFGMLVVPKGNQNSRCHYNL